MANGTRNNDLRYWIVPFLVLFQAIVAVSPSGAQVTTADHEATRGFTTLCSPPNGHPLIDVTFAPVRRLAEDEDPLDGTWRYSFETPDHAYRNNSYSLSANGGRIYLVSTLRPPAQGQLPAYLWHVISVPTPDIDGIGYIARHREFREESDVEAQYRGLALSQRKTDEGDFLFYVERRLLRQEHEAALTRVGLAWRETFGDAMRELITQQVQMDDRVYTHTFIYVDAPKEVGDIHRDTGDRRVSSRARMESRNGVRIRA